MSLNVRHSFELSGEEASVFAEVGASERIDHRRPTSESVTVQLVFESRSKQERGRQSGGLRCTTKGRVLHPSCAVQNAPGGVAREPLSQGRSHGVSHVLYAEVIPNNDYVPFSQTCR